MIELINGYYAGADSKQYIVGRPYVGKDQKTRFRDPPLFFHHDPGSKVSGGPLPAGEGGGERDHHAAGILTGSEAAAGGFHPQAGGTGSLTGKASQRKGAGGERELAEILRTYGYSAKRGGSLSFGEVPDLVGLPGIHIECKRVERLNVSEAMQQAIRDSRRFRDGMPVLFHRKNREPWLVTMTLEDWMKLYGKECEIWHEGSTRS